jgi:hypothetical protein
MPTKKSIPEVPSAPIPVEPILTALEACEVLRIPVKTEKQAVRKLYELTPRRAGRPAMPALRVGKQLRFLRSQIMAWLLQCQAEKAAA